MHRMGRSGHPEFLVHWEHSSNALDSWENLESCLSLGLSAWLKYCREHELTFPLHSLELKPPILAPTEVGDSGFESTD